MKLTQRAFTGKLSDGDIRLLRIFCTVVERGGFAAAESELQIGLPSISRYMKDLETRLAVRLCVRGRAGFSLTEQGRQVYAASQQLIADIERFELDIRSIHSDLVGSLNIGIVDSLITDKNFPMPRILKAYKLRHPRVQINLSVKTSNVIEQSVLDGSLHAGIVIGRRHIPQLENRFLYQEKSNLYCSREHVVWKKYRDNISIDDLSKHDYVGFHFMEEMETMQVKGILNKTATVDHMEAVATLISTGCFMGFLPDHYVQSIWHSEHFRKILPEKFAFTTNIEFVTRHGASSPFVAELMHQIDVQMGASVLPESCLIERRLPNA